MYLRLPRVVGHAGLYTALGIILVAHVISVATGLSISSIATDKRVGAGGPYYVLSRSLGLPLGGTIGLALFIGLSFSISLYVIGFSESFLAYIGIEATPFWIRVVGTTTVVLITIITFVSTSLAIKTQYLILALIGLSLVSIFLGNSPRPESALLSPAADAPPTALLFGIFFPAVTGFTAGVNMSGDLKDPKRSIPTGTILAIATGLLVYLSLALFLAFRVPPDLLRDDPEVLLHVAWSPALVVAGIWGATLSSALGSILGAPRILQSMSTDRVTPRIFAKGYGPTSEPRNALLLAFLVGEAGILIAELDLIARVVSMVFLAMYGFINIACAIENWASPDFRPSFRIPKWVSVLGAVTCLVVMIQLDLMAMAGSLLLMLGLYAYLQRRRLTLHSGDAWEGVWSSLVRTGLRRLSQVEPQAHNWKPNIIAFTTPADPSVRPLALSLVASAGVATEFTIVGRAGDALEATAAQAATPLAAAPTGTELSPTGIFTRTLSDEDPLGAIGLLAHHYGFSGVRPNTLLLPLSLQERDPRGFDKLLADVADCDHNLLIAGKASQLTAASARRIDVWWHEQAGNFAFSVALVRFLSRASDWRAAPIRFWILTRESVSEAVLLMEARQYLRQARLEAEVRIFHQPAAMRTPLETALNEAEPAGLIIAGLPRLEADRALLRETLQQACGFERPLLLYQAAHLFPEVLRALDPSFGRSLPPPAPEETGATAPLSELLLPGASVLASAISFFDQRAQELLTESHSRAIRVIYVVNQQLIQRLWDAQESLRVSAQASLAGGAGRARGDLAEALSSFRQEVESALRDYQQRGMEEQRAVLRADAVELMKEARWLSDERRAFVVVKRGIEDYAPSPDDTKAVRRIKRRARWSRRLGARSIKYKLPLTALQRYHHRRFVQAIVRDEARQFCDDSRQLMTELSKALNRPSKTLAFARSVYGGSADAASALSYLEELSRVCSALQQRQEQRLRNYRAEAAARGRRLALELAADLQRLDARAFIAKERRSSPADAPDPAAFAEGIERWREHQVLLIERIVLGQRLAQLMQAFSCRCYEIRDEVLLGPGAAAFRDCQRLANNLTGLIAGRRLDTAELERLSGTRPGSWEPQAIVERLTVELSSLMAQIPEKVTTISDESLLQLMARKASEVEALEVNLRRGMDVVVSRELLAPLHQKLIELENAQRSASTVVADTAQLLAFHVHDSAEGLLPLAERSLGRSEAQLKLSLQTRGSLEQLIDGALESVAAAANVNELEKLQEQLQREDLYNRARAAERGAKSVLARARRVVSGTLTDLLYRRSRGVLAARKLGATRRAAADVELRSLIEETEPRANVTRKLPRFYRQLFSGQAAVGGSFQVRRPSMDRVVDDAIERWKSGAGGAILIVGEPGSGKSTLILELLQRLDAPAVVRAQPPDGGAASLPQLEQTLRTASNLPHSADPLSELPDGTAVVLDDLELWWERRDGGLEVAEHLLDRVREHGRRLLFVMSSSSYAHDLLDRLVPLSSAAAAVISCEPFSAEELRQAVMRRHQSTGLKFEYGSASEDDLGEWGVARLFTRHFDYCSGNIAAAFRGWLSHIEATDGESIRIRAPLNREWDALDEMDGDAKSVLLQLMLHKQASSARLMRIFGRDQSDMDRVVRELLNTSLLTRHANGTMAINDAIRHQVGSHFLRRGLL